MQPTVSEASSRSASRPANAPASSRKHRLSKPQRASIGRAKSEQRLRTARELVLALQDDLRQRDEQLVMMRHIIASLQGELDSRGILRASHEPAVQPAAASAEHTATQDGERCLAVGDPLVFDLFDTADAQEASVQTDISVCHGYPDVFVSAQQLAVAARPHSLTTNSGVEHASADVNATSAAVVTTGLPHSLTTGSGVEHASYDVNATSASVVAPGLPHSLTIRSGVEHASYDVNATSAAAALDLGARHSSADAAAGAATALECANPEPLPKSVVAGASTGLECAHPELFPLPVVLFGGGTSVTTLEPAAVNVRLVADNLGGHLPPPASSELSDASLVVGCGNDSCAQDGGGDGSVTNTGQDKPECGRFVDFISQTLAYTAVLSGDTQCGPLPTDLLMNYNSQNLASAGCMEFNSQRPAQLELHSSGNDSCAQDGGGHGSMTNTGHDKPECGRFVDFNSQPLANTAVLSDDTQCGPLPTDMLKNYNSQNPAIAGCPNFNSQSLAHLELHSTPCHIKATVPHGSQKGAGREPGAVSARTRDKTSRAKQRGNRSDLGREPGAVSARIRDKTSRRSPTSLGYSCSPGYTSGSNPSADNDQVTLSADIGDIAAAAASSSTGQLDFNSQNLAAQCANASPSASDAIPKPPLATSAGQGSKDSTATQSDLQNKDAKPEHFDTTADVGAYAPSQTLANSKGERAASSNRLEQLGHLRVQLVNSISSAGDPGAVHRGIALIDAELELEAAKSNVWSSLLD